MHHVGLSAEGVCWARARRRAAPTSPTLRRRCLHFALLFSCVDNTIWNLHHTVVFRARALSRTLRASVLRQPSPLFKSPARAELPAIAVCICVATHVFLASVFVTTSHTVAARSELCGTLTRGAQRAAPLDTDAWRAAIFASANAFLQGMEHVFSASGVCMSSGCQMPRPGCRYHGSAGILLSSTARTSAIAATHTTKH